jgi:porin
LAGVLLAATQALAQDDKKTDEDKPADPDTGESTIEEKTLGLLPNPLQRYGIKFAATYIGEALGNTSGGKQGAIYEGRLNLAVDVDLQKLVGIDKLTFHANMFQIHGDGLSRSNLDNFLVVRRHRSAARHPALGGLLREAVGREEGFAQVRPARSR